MEDIILYAAYALIVVGIILAIGMPLIKSLDNPRSLIKTVGGVVVLAIIFFIAFTPADGEVLPKFAADPFNLTETSSRVVGGILLTTYVLFAFAVIGIIVTEINKATK